VTASRTAWWVTNPLSRGCKAGHSQPAPAGPPDLRLRAAAPSPGGGIQAAAAGRDVLAVLPTAPASRPSTIWPPSSSPDRRWWYRPLSMYKQMRRFAYDSTSVPKNEASVRLRVRPSKSSIAGSGARYVRGRAHRSDRRKRGSARPPGGPWQAARLRHVYLASDSRARSIPNGRMASRGGCCCAVAAGSLTPGSGQVDWLSARPCPGGALALDTYSPGDLGARR
jgi:hypothetical protein